MFANNFLSNLGWAVLFSVLGSGSIALADYQPPNEEAASGSTVANGSRTSCLFDDDDTMFTPLIPIGHIAQGDGDRQPELTFYVPTTSPYRVDVVLLDEEGELVEFLEVSGTEPGLVSMSVSPELEPGRYEIQTGVACDDADQYHTQVIAYFELNETLPETIQRELADITDPSIQSDIYADAGYWLDAFALANEDQRVDLLVDLAKFETDAQQDNLEAIVQVLMAR